MSLFDQFRYDGKRVLVVGGATGIGAAAAELTRDGGADVIVMDVADVTLRGASAIRVNLAERDSIDVALDQCPTPVHAVFGCAGVADGTPGIERINFVGHRYLIDRLMERQMLPRGSAICFISSSAGLGWEPNFVELAKLLDTPGFDDAANLMRERRLDNYMSTKQAVCAYVAREALRFLKDGIRINALCPGPTDTPLANKEAWLGGGADYRREAGIEPSTPMEQAYPLVFLCSDAAPAITGITLLSDGGWVCAGMTGSFSDAASIAGVLMNRPPAYQQGVPR